MRQTYHILDGFRGLAAICVVMYHCADGTNSPFRSGFLAPDLFFVLSGFVIAFAYKERLLASLTLIDFMRTRAIRLYPFYAIGLLLAGVAVYLNPPQASAWAIAQSFTRAALFIPGGDLYGEPAQNLYPLNGPAWSLFYELVINFSYALSISFLNRRSLSVVAIASGILLLIIDHFRGTMMGGWILNPGHMLIGTLRVTFSFSLGLLIYEFRDNIPKLKIPALLLLGASVIPYMCAPSRSIQGLYEAICIFIVFPTLVALGSTINPNRILARVCAWLGAISYGVYIIHVPLLAIANHFVPRSHVAWDIVLTALAVLFAWIVNIYVDQPVRAYLLGRRAKRAQPHN